MIEGEINQISIPVTDFEVAKEFYENLFGWEVDIELYKPNYAIVKWENTLSLGFYPSKNIITGGPMLIFSVASIDKSIELIKNGNGKILQDKHPMSEGQFGVVFQDPFANRFRLIGK